jgi:hypothetical protein
VIVDDIDTTCRAKKVFSRIVGTANISTNGPDSPPALFKANHLTSKFNVSGIVDDAIGLSSFASLIVHTNEPVNDWLTMIVVASAFHLFSAIKLALYAIRTQPQI